MSDDRVFVIDARTGNVLLHGELLHNKSWHIAVCPVALKRAP